ncbi:unannotated protein [freshwater metagenome]|uniref:Unannotated protein n=1 Tax=freshwater metagenome TaxID=449393 RepID=A0A6J7GER7_9ZZZZ
MRSRPETLGAAPGPLSGCAEPRRRPMRSRPETLGAGPGPLSGCAEPDAVRRGPGPRRSGRGPDRFLYRSTWTVPVEPKPRRYFVAAVRSNSRPAM